MSNDHRRADTRRALDALLDDPSFLKEILQRVIQELLEADMTEHLGTSFSKSLMSSLAGSLDSEPAPPYEVTSLRVGCAVLFDAELDRRAFD